MFFPKVSKYLMYHCVHFNSKINCATHQARNTRGTNDTAYQLDDNTIEAAVREESWLENRLTNGAPSGVVAQGGTSLCGAGDGQVPLEVEMVVGSGDVLSADTLIRADHRANIRK
jgi:osmotically-inducible protein OsmY